MRRHDCAGVDHGITQGLGLLALTGVDPDGGQAECGIAGRRGQASCAGHRAGIDRQVLADVDLARADLHAFEGDAVSIGT